MQILGLSGMYFDSAVVLVTSHSLLFRLALAILLCFVMDLALLCTIHWKNVDNFVFSDPFVLRVIASLQLPKNVGIFYYPVLYLKVRSKRSPKHSAIELWTFLMNVLDSHFTANQWQKYNTYYFPMHFHFWDSVAATSTSTSTTIYRSYTGWIVVRYSKKLWDSAAHFLFVFYNKVQIFWEDHKNDQSSTYNLTLNKKWKMGQIFVAFSEYLNFNKMQPKVSLKCVL